MQDLPDIGMPLGDVEPLLSTAAQFAHAHRMQQLGTESLLAALIEKPTPGVARIMQEMGVDLPLLSRKIEEFFVDLPGRRTTRVEEISATPRTKLAIKLAAQLAKAQGEAELNCVYLLKAIALERDSVGGQLLAQLGAPETPVHVNAEPMTMADFAKTAKTLIEPVAYDYFVSGSDGQTVKARNRAAWDALEIRHRVLVDVSKVDASTELLGLKLPFPALIAPMAYQKLAHTDGEIATAKAAAAAGVPMVVSTMANCTLEEVASATAAPKWFQLYCHRDRDITRDLIRRAEQAGYAALVVTVDAPVLGRRLADERNGFELPPGLTRANLARYENSDERRTSRVKEAGPRPDALELQPLKFTTAEVSHLSQLFTNRQDAALTWKDIDWFKSLTSLPILLKGIVRGDDARRAADAGCAGVIVSNHGGRQLDASIASARALPDVVDAVNGRIPVLVDGAIEWGADILRALALGAKAVLIGRPVLWGLAVGGEQGVQRVLSLYAEDFTRAMQLAGCPSVADVNQELLA